MKIVVPYTPDGLRDETADAVRRVHPALPIEWEDVSSSDRAYADLLEYLWIAGESFIVVEHDIAPTPQQLSDMVTCHNWWCCAPHQVGTGVTTVGTLGLVRFRSQLLAAEPDLVTEAFRFFGPTCDGVEERDWRRCDTRIGRVLDQRGYTPCVHDEVLHLHRYRWTEAS